MGRKSAGLSEGLWRRIDEGVTHVAKENLTSRRFLPLAQLPKSNGQSIILDTHETTEVKKDGYIYTQSRRLLNVPALYDDFWLYWRDLETQGEEVDLAAALSAAQSLAAREDRMVFYGMEALGLEGLANAKGTFTIKRKAWEAGENAFADIAAGAMRLQNAGRTSGLTLLTSTDVYQQLLRLQPQTGLLETTRIEKFLHSKILPTFALKPGTALLVCAEPQYMELSVGQDIRTAYLETVDMNHHFRILETAVLRIKSPDAIIVYQ